MHSAFLIAPPSLSLSLCRVLVFKAPGKIWGSTGKMFLSVLAVMTIIYPYYNFAIDAPMYWKRYEADQKAGKQYLPFWEGLVDAWKTRHKSHLLADWGQVRCSFWNRILHSECVVACPPGGGHSF
jgi:hypothetical protein